MDGKEFKAAIDALGYNQRTFASQVGANYRTVQKWVSGETRIPGIAITLVRLLQERPELVGVLREIEAPKVRSRLG